MAVVIVCSEHHQSKTIKTTTCRRSRRVYAEAAEKVVRNKMTVAMAMLMATSRKEL